MPSLPHELYVELFRNCGLLAREFLHGRTDLPAGDLLAESLSADLSHVVPTEYRADHVIALRTPGGDHHRKPDLVVIVEVQLSIDHRKRHTWPIYVTTAAGKYDCAVKLLVFAPDPHVARWAVGPFGPPSDFMLRPIVISFAEVPRSLDAEAARRLPELAVLVALAHPTVETATTALATFPALLPEHSQLYLDVIMKALADAGGATTELPMIEGYKYQSDFARKYYAQGEEAGHQKGRREGQEEGRREGQEEGRREGQEEGRQEALSVLHGTALALARLKLGEVTPAGEAAVRSLRDHAQLSALIVELGLAREPEQARAAIGRATTHPA